MDFSEKLGYSTKENTNDTRKQGKTQADWAPQDHQTPAELQALSMRGLPAEAWMDPTQKEAEEAMKRKPGRPSLTWHRQHRAQIAYGYGPITLRREGDFAIVEIEFQEKRYPVIREHVDSNFCHTVEPIGIEAVITGQEPA